MNYSCYYLKMWFKFSRENVLLVLLFLNLFIHFGNFTLLETGYKYDKGIIKPNCKKNDITLLKCTYLFSGMNHLKLTKILFEQQLCDMQTVISLVSFANDFIKKQIATLYYSKEVEVGSLWLLNMYTCLIGKYLERSKNNVVIKHNDSKVVKIIECHEYVIKKLASESKNCPQKSRFYFDNMDFNINQNLTYEIVKIFILKNKDDMEYLINNNNNTKILEFGNIKVFSRPYLYLKKFGYFDIIVFKFINNFNLRIKWGNIANKFKNVYYNANILNWSTQNLRSCLLFYSMVFNLFKVIMLRLTWKQFLYIKQQNASLIVNLTDQWLITLNGFTKYLALENDYIIKSVIDSLSVHIKNYPSKDDGTIDLNKIPTYQMQYTDQLINNISNIISNLCEGLECTIVKNWNKEEVLQTSNQIHFYLDRDVLKSNEVFKEIIVTWSKKQHIYKTISFGDFLHYLYKDVDFHVIRSFIDYIETLNNYTLFDGE